MDKIHPKCDWVNGSIVNGLRQPILHSPALDKTPGHRILRKARNLFNSYKKMENLVMNKTTLYVEDDEKTDVVFDGNFMTFTLFLGKL